MSGSGSPKRHAPQQHPWERDTPSALGSVLDEGRSHATSTRLSAPPENARCCIWEHASSSSRRSHHVPTISVSLGQMGPAGCPWHGGERKRRKTFEWSPDALPRSPPPRPLAHDRSASFWARVTASGNSMAFWRSASEWRREICLKLMHFPAFRVAPYRHNFFWREW